MKSFFFFFMFQLYFWMNEGIVNTEQKVHILEICEAYSKREKFFTSLKH
jgi:hypothetical protein